MGINTMAITANNPLFKHFRQPAIYLKLPSQGQYWDESAIDLPASGEIPVYPMTVKDEITFKTPDALMNGEGMVSVIQSCCPSIKNAWAIPTIDLDPIMISIRIASYGSDMDITTKCPHCGEENLNTVDLGTLLDSLPAPDFPAVQIGELTFNIKPLIFESLNKANLYSFEQQKLIMAITSSDLTEEQKMEQFKDLFPKITDLNIMTIVNAIESIVTKDGTQVAEEKFIKEFIYNCETALYNEIKTTVENISKSNKLHPMKIACESCTKEYSSDLTFEESNFFA